MGKIFAILAAGAVASGGAAYAVIHHLDPYAADHAGCPLARMACCTTTESATAASPDCEVVATTPVSADAPSCCALAAKPAARASCCASGAACCAALEPCCPALTAAVGPAAAAR